MGKIPMGPPPSVEQTDRQTRVKTLPSRTTLRAVIINGKISIYEVKLPWLITCCVQLDHL